MRSIIAANWKMHKNRAEARDLARALARDLADVPARPGVEIVLFPPFTALEAAREGLEEAGIALGGQNVYPAQSGAFTGEISPDMLRDAGCSWVLTGHSERRHILGESSALVGEKTAFALKSGLSVILCVGETLDEREAGRLEDVLQAQVAAGLAGVPAEDLARLAVAYEPVWAIGTGRVASPDDIVAAHAFVRGRLNTLCGPACGQTMRILYGGSVKPENAAGILGLDNVNGLLVGGASLQAETFLRIIRAGQTA